MEAKPIRFPEAQDLDKLLKKSGLKPYPIIEPKEHSSSPVKSQHINASVEDIKEIN